MYCYIEEEEATSKGTSNKQGKGATTTAKANKRNFQPQKIKGKVYGAREFAFDTVKKTEPLKIDIEFPKFYKSEEQPQLPGINWNKLAKANGLAGMLGENTDTAIGVEDIDE